MLRLGSTSPTEKNFRTLGCIRTALDSFVFLFLSPHFEVLELPRGFASWISAAGLSFGCSDAFFVFGSRSRRLPPSAGRRPFVLCWVVAWVWVKRAYPKLVTNPLSSNVGNRVSCTPSACQAFKATFGFFLPKKKTKRVGQFFRRSIFPHAGCGCAPKFKTPERTRTSSSILHFASCTPMICHFLNQPETPDGCSGPLAASTLTTPAFSLSSYFCLLLVEDLVKRGTMGRSNSPSLSRRRHVIESGIIVPEF